MDASQITIFENVNVLLIGCCTSCAVRIKSGELRQPEALGISAELKEQACIAFAVLIFLCDLVCFCVIRCWVVL